MVDEEEKEKEKVEEEVEVGVGGGKGGHTQSGAKWTRTQTHGRAPGETT